MSSDTSPFKQAVLYAAKPDPAPLGPITAHTPAFLLPFAGKCLADRILGQLSDLGVETITILMADDAHAAAVFFGDGTRWGVRLALLDVRKKSQMFQRLIGLDLNEPFLLGDLYRLPGMGPDLLDAMAQDETTLVLDEKGNSSGWAALSPATLAAGESDSIENLFERLHQAKKSTTVPGTMLSAFSAEDMLDSTRALLENRIARQTVSGASGEPGIWIGAGSVIHPSVEITPPVWVGENCRLERGVRLGPNVCVADNCVLGEASVLENSSILPGTCIGNELELHAAVADRNYLAYADSGQTVAIPDPFLLAPNKPIYVMRMLASALGRLVALLLLLPSLPLLVFFWLVGLACGQPQPLCRTNHIRLPAPTDPMLWRTFRLLHWNSDGKPSWARLCQSRLMRILAAIPNIAFGQLHWVGLAPRTLEETDALPEDWRTLYLESKPGLFQLAESDQRQTGESSPEQQYGSEVYYTATQSFSQDLKILLRCLFTPTTQKPKEPQAAIVSIPSGPQALDQLHQFLNEQLRKFGQPLDQERKDAIVTAVHEAVANVLRHAYENQEGLPLQLHLLQTPDQLEISIYDQGCAYDPDSIPLPDFSETAEGGFGWFLIREIAREVSLTRDGNWNQLKLVFDLNPKGESQNGH
jgi:anti-sigma regulatory factor (Ser/Thr protein kinase)